MPAEHQAVSISLHREMAEELRRTAGRRGVNVSKVAQAAIGEYVKIARADSLNGGEPLAEIKPRVIEAWEDPAHVGLGVGDPTIERQREQVIGQKAAAEEAARRRSLRRPPRIYTVGGFFCTFAQPVTPEMCERVGQAVERELRLAWTEEQERRAGENGA